jgi:CBS domain-containing protein
MEFTAQSIMRPNLVICDSKKNLREVARKMYDEKVGSILVKQEGEIKGIIVNKDILKAVMDGKDFTLTQAAEIMTSPLGYCNADDSLEKCMDLFKETKHTRLVVKEGDKVVGVLLRKFAERFLKMSKRYSLSKIASTPRFRTGRG